MSEIRVDTISEKTTANGVSIDSVTLKDGGATLSDNLLFNASGKGVYLGVTSATASNLLNDYEEGTWTPTVDVGTITATDCIYTKVGRKVFIQGRVDTFSDSTSSNAIYFRGLPFTASSSQTAVGSVMYRYLDLNTNYYSIVPFVTTGGSEITFYEIGDNVNWTQISHSDITSANTRFYFSISYMTTA